MNQKGLDFAGLMVTDVVEAPAALFLSILRLRWMNCPIGL